MYWDTGSNQIPVTADDVEGRKQVPFSSSFLPALQRRELWTCQLCTFGLYKTGSLKWDFYDASREKFPFHFFQSWQEESSACLIRFSASFLHTCQGHGLNICMVLRGRQLSSAPCHCQQRCISSTAVQYLPPVLCSFLLMGRHLSRGSWPGLGSCSV